jgi:hypothetical protein
MSNRVTKKLTVESNSGKSFEIEVTAVGEYDNNHGADADGNRGTSGWTVKEFDYELPDTDEDTNVLSLDELHELDIALNKQALKEEWAFSQEEDWDNYKDYELGTEDL